MPHFESRGHRLFYREEGRGPLLVVLHGNTSSSALHAGEVEHFARRFRTVAPDFLGVGQSQRFKSWPHEWWLEAAHDVAALVAHLGEERPILVGTSGGGVAALLAAIHYPERVRAVVADSCVEDWTPEEIGRLIEPRSRMSIGQMAFWQKAHGDDWAEVAAADTGMILGWRETGITFYRGRLGQIRCPVLLTDSLRDEMLPRVAQQIPKMLTEIPDCRAYLVNQGRHPMMWSRAEEFRRAADAFLAGIV